MRTQGRSSHEIRGAMQAAGLKYHDDLQRRIPREEVAVIEAVVREAVVDLLHCREAHDASTLFCYAVGRWGRRTCSVKHLLASLLHSTWYFTIARGDRPG